MTIRDKAYADFDAGKITREQRNEIIDKTGVANETKYSQYQLSGGKNYKEILIKAPSKTVQTPAEVKTLQELSQKLSRDGRDALTDAEIATYNKLNKGEDLQANTTFKSSHWDEPNVISHLRLNERTYKGKKVTFMEELQSDWAREGRSKGFLQPEKQVKSLPEGYKVNKEISVENGVKHPKYWVTEPNGDRIT